MLGRKSSKELGITTWEGPFAFLTFPLLLLSSILFLVRHLHHLVEDTYIFHLGNYRFIITKNHHKQRLHFTMNNSICQSSICRLIYYLLEYLLICFVIYLYPHLLRGGEDIGSGRCRSR